jgi:hypothetical protein
MALTVNETIRSLGIGKIFGLLQDVVRELNGFNYKFLHNEEFTAADNVREVNRIYWFEILERAHLGAATGLLRHHRWLEGAVAAGCSPNFLAFAASLRGFIESLADIWDGLNGVASSFATEFQGIRSAIAGELDTLFCAQELEDRLIHFQFARKIQVGEPHLPIHWAKHPKEYLTKLSKSEAGPLHDCYAELCAVTHPGAESLLWFTLGRVGASDTQYVLTNSPDDQAIRALCAKFAKVPPWVVQQGLNLPLVLLKTMNGFGIRAVYTRVLDEINLDHIPLWCRIKEQIQEAKTSRTH